MGELIGYARCCTVLQDLTAQRQALTALGVPDDRIYLNKGLTGTSRTRCSAPFSLSTWKRVGVVRHEHAGPGLAAGVRFRARRHCEHGAARCRSPGHGRGRMVVMMSFPGG